MNASTVLCFTLHIQEEDFLVLFVLSVVWWDFCVCFGYFGGLGWHSRLRLLSHQRKKIMMYNIDIHKTYNASTHKPPTNDQNWLTSDSQYF